jgi:2-iminobutanoate/2-iminopropanoate deaminase
MKKIIKAANAPSPVGPYNHATAAGGFLFVSGQIALDPATGNLIMDDIESETKRVMENLKAILTEAGYTFEDVVKSTIFLKDMEMFAKVNGVYGGYFNEATAPARETVQVSNLPKYVNVEISCIAYKS